MSGLDKIISRLENDCTKECEEIRLAAENSAAATLAEAKTEAEKKAAEIISDAEKQAELISSKAVSARGLYERQAMLRAKVGIIGEVTDAAERTMHDMSADVYFNTLSMLASKNSLEGKGVMYLCKKDLDRLPADFSKSLGGSIEICSEPIDIEDGFILKYGDIEINCTFKAMFSAVRDDLKAVAGEILFG